MTSDQPTEPPHDDDPEQTICFCHNVQLGRILKVIRAGGKTLHDIQVETCASTGCGGCEWQILEILQSEKD